MGKGDGARQPGVSLEAAARLAVQALLRIALEDEAIALKAQVIVFGTSFRYQADN